MELRENGFKPHLSNAPITKPINDRLLSPLKEKELKRRNLSIYLEALNIDVPLIPTIGNLKKTIMELDVDKLRQLQDAISPIGRSDESYGSLTMIKEVVEENDGNYPNKYSDIQKPEYKIEVAPGKEEWNLDFLPFGEAKRLKGLETQAIFLGCIDLARLIDAHIGKKDLPAVVLGRTNATMARFAIDKMGFHSWGATIQKGKTGSLVPRDKVISLMKDVSAGNKIMPEGENLNIQLFMDSNELFSVNKRQQIQHLIERLYKFMKKDNTDEIGQEKLASLEREIRAKAIIETALHEFADKQV